MAPARSSKISLAILGFLLLTACMLVCGCVNGNNGDSVNGMGDAGDGMLDIAPSAVSQYRSKKRGYRIEFDEDIKEEIKHIADDLNSGAEVSVNKRICKICGMIRTDGGCGTEASDA